MNNNIKESLCSFEVSKLLKEKGFKVPTLCYYFEDGEFRQNKLIETTGMDYGSEFTIEYQEFLENWNNNWLTKKNGDRCFGCKKSNEYFETYSSPTHTLAIEWLRVNYNIHIYSFPIYISKAIGLSELIGYCFHANKHYLDKEFKTPQEAVEAALLYTLNKKL